MVEGGVGLGGGAHSAPVSNILSALSKNIP